MSRILVLDYGSNSLRWLVVDRVDSRGTDAPLGPVESGGRSTGLGRPGEDGRVSMEAVENTLAATREAIARGRELGVNRTLAVATHFARELPGVETLADALKSRWGVELTLLSGPDEAWLTRVGVDEGLRCLDLDGRVYLAVDVGGGSTEFSWWGCEETRGLNPLPPKGGRERRPSRRLNLFTQSFPLGAINLTGRHFHTDPPAPGEMGELRDGVRAVFSRLPMDTHDLPVVASGGTATALAALHLGLNEYLPLVIQGTPLSRGDLAALIERLAGVPLAERKRLLPTDERRAEIIVAGALVLETLLAHLGDDGRRPGRRLNLLVSDYDLKHGAAVALGGDKPATLPSKGFGHGT